jgi:dTDP-glucose pyrophosphorylase/transcriptional regulator with XRE-family HTH domain
MEREKWEAFGRRVRDLRETKKRSLAQLAQELGCSAPKLYKLEHGKLKKGVTAHFIQQLCDALALSDNEVDALFKQAGYKAPAPEDVHRIVRVVQETLQIPEFSDFADELFAEVQAFVINWQAMRRARQQKVRKVVIAAAGWQPRLLSLNRFERTLLPAIDEAARAGIFQVLLVVPPNTPEMQDLRTSFPVSSITQVVQHEPLGLGNALLAAREHIDAEPFAVLLPDEIDDSRTALRDLVEAYDDVHKPLVAVDACEPKDNIAVLRRFGFALLDHQIRPHVFALKSGLIEKPQERLGEDHLRIAGRYILTPEIVHALQRTQHVGPGPVKHDLTAAINQLWSASRSVLAYRLRRKMVSIAPYRDIIQSMDMHKRKLFDLKTYRHSGRLQARRS